MGKTNISWTDQVWNPVTGCSRVSEGCRSCYAEALSLRRGWSKKPWTHQNAAENVVLHPKRLEQPFHWRKPRMVFVNSMSDMFHKQVPFNFIAQVFDVMADARASHHTFQVLTKRPHRMRKFFKWLGERRPGGSPATLGGDVTAEVHGALPNVWPGVSVEDQRRADERIPVLLDTPAAVRFLSLEPLLEWVSIYEYLRTGAIGWVIVGGESGPQHRPMELSWLRNIRDECSQAKVPLFVKQDAGSRPGKQGRIPDELWALNQYPKVAT